MNDPISHVSEFLVHTGNKSMWMKDHKIGNQSRAASELNLEPVTQTVSSEPDNQTWVKEAN